MKHTPRSRRITFASMGVFMTAGEANRQRVFRLLRFEREQMWAQSTTVDIESPAVKRGKPPISENSEPACWTQTGPILRMNPIGSTL